LRLVTLPGVFSPRPDTRMLARVLCEPELVRGASVLDVCTGSGALAVAAALAGAREVTAVDLSRRAVATARLNARRNGVRVRALRGDLFGPVAGRRFDVIVSNPPYVPARSPRLPRRGARRAWDAGVDGRALLDRICREAGAHLAPGGRLLVVHSSVADIERTERALRESGLEAGVVARERGALGPLLTARAAMLRERGLLPEGRLEEELAVVRGELRGLAA
jgi:release factor glutamine methyltransferase